MTETDHKSTAIIERGSVGQLHPLQILQQAVMQGMSPDVIGQLMDLAERHQENEAKRAYTKAMVSLKEELPTVLMRDQKVDFSTSKGKVSYTHTSLAAVMDAVTGPLARHGFSIAWSPTTVDGGDVRVTCRITHSLGHSEETSLQSGPDKSGLKSPAQGIASTITLLERYTALSLLGIATADMVEQRVVDPQPDAIDSKANLVALKTAVDLGIKKDDVIEHMGKPMQEWTAADLSVLRMWLLDEVLGKLHGAKCLDDVVKIGDQLKTLNLRGTERERAVEMYKERKLEFEREEWKDVGPPPMEREPGEDG